MERTFVMIKPDGVSRQLIGPIVTRFEQKGMHLRAIQLMMVEKTVAEQHYREHESRPFFKELVQYLIASPVCAMVWEGQHAVANARALIGKTNPVEAAPGSIRGDYASDIAGNIIHGSDSLESAQREISLFFHDDRPFPMLFDTTTSYPKSVNISH